MKKIHPRRMVGGLLAAAALLLAPAPAQNDGGPVRAYPAAPGEPLSTQFSVRAGGHDVPVYLATVLAMPAERRLKHDLHHFADGDTGETSFASFDLRGPATVAVTCPTPAASARILPASRGIQPTISGNVVTFAVKEPGPLVLELNGDRVQVLQVFANPWESDAPDPNDPKVIYYGPGIHRVASVQVGSGQTVYLAPGAVVYGTPDGPEGPIFHLRGDHIALRGRGIVDGSLCPHGVRGMVVAEGRDISIRDVVLRDSGEWTTHLLGCDRVEVRNIKVLGYRGNSDGIDVNGCRDVAVFGCYLRTGDDLVTIKSKTPEKGETRDVDVEHCVLWNELAQALIVGGEMRRDVSRVRFADCDVVHDLGREALLRIAQCDGGRVGGIVYENIRIEECRRLISLRVEAAGHYGRDPERGHIDGVVFRNIASVPPGREPDLPAVLSGLDAGHTVANVRFDRVTIGGRSLSPDDVKRNAFVSGVTVTP